MHDETLSGIRNVLASHENRAEEFNLTREGAEFYNKDWIIPEEHINWTALVPFIQVFPNGWFHPGKSCEDAFRMNIRINWISAPR